MGPAAAARTEVWGSRGVKPVPDPVRGSALLAEFCLSCGTRLKTSFGDPRDDYFGEGFCELGGFLGPCTTSITTQHYYRSG